MKVGRCRMVVKFTITCAFSAYHHSTCDPANCDEYSTQHYVIKDTTKQCNTAFIVPAITRFASTAASFVKNDILHTVHYDDICSPAALDLPMLVQLRIINAIFVENHLPGNTVLHIT